MKIARRSIAAMKARRWLHHRAIRHPKKELDQEPVAHVPRNRGGVVSAFVATIIRPTFQVLAPDLDPQATLVFDRIRALVTSFRF